MHAGHCGTTDKLASFYFALNHGPRPQSLSILRTLATAPSLVAPPPLAQPFLDRFEAQPRARAVEPCRPALQTEGNGGNHAAFQSPQRLCVHLQPARQGGRAYPRRVALEARARAGDEVAEQARQPLAVTLDAAARLGDAARQHGR